WNPSMKGPRMLVSRVRTRLSTPAVPALLVLLAGTSLCEAALPAVLDRVPKDAPVVVTVQHLGKLEAERKKVSKYSDEIANREDFISDLDQLATMPGINHEGSAAIVVYPPKQEHVPHEGEEPQGGGKDGGDQAAAGGDAMEDEEEPDGDDEVEK